MGIDLDQLDEIFADEGVKNAQPVGKFRPKSKPKPKFWPMKKDSAAPLVSSLKPVQIIDTTAVGLNVPAQAPKPSENCPDASDDNKGGCASLEKLTAENANVLIGLESLGDIPQSNTSDMEGSAPPSELPNSEIAEGQVHQFLASVDDATHGNDVSKCNEISADQDPRTSSEPIVSSGDGCGQLPNEELHREVMDIFDSINMSASTTKSEQRREKFLPKQNMQKQKKIQETNESVSCSIGSQSVQPKNNSSFPTFQQDDMLNLSDLGITHMLPTEVTPEIPLTEESVNLVETTKVVLEVPAKLTLRRAKTLSSKTQTASDPSPQQPPASTSGEGNELYKSRKRKGKTNLRELVDEDEEEVVAGGEISDENPIDSAMEEENVLNEESQVENESQKKKMKRKAKKPDDDKEKPTRKRKKTEGAPDKGADAKPKKFSHSTRRRVNKDLLAIPEDEIEYQKVPLRDLLVLADYRERQMKRDGAAAAAAATATKQSNGNSSNRNYEDDAFNSREDGEYDDEQGGPEMEDTTVFFNYHSYMDRTPATRWSKQETEVFYEAVRQFGTDLSMIQQLFPDRTRRQVKLKYKNEERQHPLRLHEALTTRSTDHSHFEKVIQHLKEVAAEENRNNEEDDPVDLTGNEEDEGTPNPNVDKKEEAKDEEIEEEAKEDVGDEVEVESPSKIEDNDEDDEFLWTYSST